MVDSFSGSSVGSSCPGGFGPGPAGHAIGASPAVRDSRLADSGSPGTFQEEIAAHYAAVGELMEHYTTHCLRLVWVTRRHRETDNALTERLIELLRAHPETVEELRGLIEQASRFNEELAEALKDVGEDIQAIVSAIKVWSDYVDEAARRNSELLQRMMFSTLAQKYHEQQKKK